MFKSKAIPTIFLKSLLFLRLMPAKKRIWEIDLE